MKKISYFLSLFLALTGTVAATAQENSISVTEVTEAPADGFYVIHSACSSGNGYLYTDANLTERPFRTDGTVDLSTQVNANDTKYIWQLTNNAEDGTFTLTHYQTKKAIPADAERNKNMSGTGAASLKLETAEGATDGNWFVYQTNYTNGGNKMYVHANKASDIDANWSYWDDASVTGTSVRLKLYKLDSEPAELPEPAEPALPFVTTTVTDGAFAPGTIWYTLKIGQNGLFLSDNSGADYIALNKTRTSFEDADLWCFTGNREEGFSIYNKAAGATKRLASPVTMTGNTGGEAYVILKEEGDDTYNYLWSLSSSSNLEDTESYYIAQYGTTYKMNNRQGKLAFWTTGQDAGSSVVISFAEVTADVNTSTGTFTASNPTKTWHAVWSSSQLEGFTLGTGVNNMTTEGENIAGYTGLSGASTYTLTAPAGYSIAGYSFDFANTNADASYALTLNVDGKNYTSSTETQHVSVEGLTERIATFSQTGANKGLTFTNFSVTVRPSMEAEEPSFEIFPCAGSEVPYRIPAIATASNGDIIAVADYRHSRADIGMANNGRIDLHGRISKDNGQTWGDIFTIVEGKGAASPDFMHVGFGDPCIVADRESNRVLVMSCAGNVSFPGGSRDKHQNIARFYSEDNGQTWSEPVDIAESIYAQFDESPFGPVKAMFIGSGKISQSKTIKIGDYYRLYCAVLMRQASGPNVNFVLYSDDFGGSWTVLGGTDVSPIPSGGDEPKAEELPDGSVIISSRAQGRLFNIFNYTDIEKGEGFWGNMTQSLASANNGICAQGGNPTNGEIMIVPAVRKEDNTPVYIALQSVPFGPNRANVGIYYKELESFTDFSSAENFAKDWDGRHQSTKLGSAYSTMTWQSNNTLGFVYEEDLYSCSGGYTITYKNYSLEQITDSVYTYNAEGIDAQAFIQPGVKEKAEAIAAKTGPYVGMLTEDGSAEINAAYAAYAEAPSTATYVTLNATIGSADRVEIEDQKVYRLRNYGRAGDKYLKALSDNLTVATLDEDNQDLLFGFAANGDGTWKIVNESQNIYIGATGENETRIPVTGNEAEAAPYRVRSTDDGLSALLCQTPVNNPAIHLAGDMTRLVPWMAASPAANGASFWYIEPTDMTLTDIENITAGSHVKETRFYDLSGRRVLSPVKGNIYVTDDRRKVLVK